jgi:TonB-dependent SusC/RagA subfamily outer membrane receptor
VNVGISEDKPKYGSRAGVNLTVDLKDKNGKPLTGNFAMAVTDNGAVDIPQYGESILTHLLLTSDLKGHIDDPGYYFESKDPSAKDALDLVMLTHGWSRFDWDDITSKPYPSTKYYLDSIININGKVSMRNGQPAKGFQVILFADKWGGSDSTEHWGKGSAFTTTNDSGYFTFQNVHFTDSTQFFLQTRNSRGNDKDVKIDITQSSLPMVVGRVDTDPFAADDREKVRKYKYVYREEIVNLGRGLTLKPITIKSYREKPNYDASRRVSQTSSIITYDQIEKVGGDVNLVNALLMVPGVGLKDGHIAIHGGRGGDVAAEPMLIVDGVQMTSTDPVGPPVASTSDVNVPNAPPSAFITALNSIQYNTIEFIEVLKDADAAIYGVRGGNGVVIINTKREVNLPSLMTKGTKTFYLPGYHVTKEFYIPRYDVPEIRDNPKRDFRSTIYWNGNIKSDASGKAMMFFYTSDAKENYTVVLEGITAGGDIVHQTATIERVR